MFFKGRKREKMHMKGVLYFYDPSFASIAKFVNFDSDSPRSISVHIKKLNHLLSGRKIPTLCLCKEKLIFYQNLVRTDMDRPYLNDLIRNDIIFESQEWPNHKKLQNKLYIIKNEK